MRLVLAGLLVARVAAAESYEEPRVPPPAATPLPIPHDDPDDWRAEGAIGVRFGSMYIDGKDVGTVSPIHLDGGVRTRRLLVYAEYDLLSFTWPGTVMALSGAASQSASTGLLQRLGGNARVAIGHLGEKDMDSNVWAEAGLGVQHVTWDAGGVWTRPDLALGVGSSMYGLGDGKHGGLTIGFRVTLARRDNASGIPICAGPCDMATAPSGWDRSIMFDMTLLFGT